MSEQDNNVNAPTQEIVETTDNDTVEQKLGDILPETKPDEVVEQKPEEKKPDDSVALGKFLAEKKARKALEKKVKELEDAINSEVEDDDDDDSLSTDIKSLAKEFDVDEKFLKKLTTSVKSDLRKEYDEKLKPITEKNKETKFNEVFSKHFTETIDSMPEYKSVVNADVIKSLSRDPQNAHLTMRELVEKTYGNALGGKRTIETTVPHGGKEPQNVDYERAQKDSAYFNDVMSDSDSKKKYNEQMLKRIAGSI